MQITKTDIDALNAQITLVIEPTDYEETVEKEIRRIRQTANIPGFRKGMVPKSLVKKMYGMAVLGDTINKVLSEKLYDYIKTEKLDILGDPLPNEELTPKAEWAEGNNFTFVFDVALAPAFDVKLNGHNKVPYYTIEVTDEMVQRQVEGYAKRFGEMKKEEGKEEPTLIPAEINSELFVKVYGESVTTEEEFRARVKAEIEANMQAESEYRFSVDAKAAVLKKAGKVTFPEAFLKRWLLATHKDLTAEKVEEDYPHMEEALLWDLAKNKLVEIHAIQIEEADVLETAKNFTRMQFMQYGLNNVDDALLTEYAAQMLKDEKQVHGIYDRALETKIFTALKAVVKLEEKTISYEDFGKLFEK